jgi:hypothetical protein
MGCLGFPQTHLCLEAADFAGPQALLACLSNIHGPDQNSKGTPLFHDPIFSSGAACGKPREISPLKISSNGRGFILRSAPLAKSLLCQYQSGVEVDLIRPLSEDFESGLNDGPPKFEGTT